MEAASDASARVAVNTTNNNLLEMSLYSGFTAVGCKNRCCSSIENHDSSIENVDSHHAMTSSVRFISVISLRVDIKSDSISMRTCRVSVPAIRETDLSIAGMYIQSREQRERSINRRHVYTKQTASARTLQAEAVWCIRIDCHGHRPCTIHHFKYKIHHFKYKIHHFYSLPAARFPPPAVAQVSLARHNHPKVRSKVVQRRPKCTEIAPASVRPWSFGLNRPRTVCISTVCQAPQRPHCQKCDPDSRKRRTSG